MVKFAASNVHAQFIYTRKYVQNAKVCLKLFSQCW